MSWSDKDVSRTFSFNHDLLDEVHKEKKSPNTFNFARKLISNFLIVKHVEG